MNDILQDRSTPGSFDPARSPEAAPVPPTGATPHAPVLPERRIWTRRRVLKTVAASLVAVGIYAWRIEPRWLQVVRKTMPIRNLPRELSGSTLVHASDLHIGPRVDDDYLLRVFHMIRGMTPEFVVYTGDFVSYFTDLQIHAPRVMSQLPSGTLGTLGILGNHDYGAGWRNMQAADRVTFLAQQAGVQILRNEIASVRGLQFAGLDELWAGQSDPRGVLSRLGPDEPCLALVHNPDAVDRPGWGSYSGWILAGHTHGGQVKPPFLPPPFLPVRNRRYTSGEFPLSGQRRLSISRGVGHSVRLRLNARPELTVFQLERM